MARRVSWRDGDHFKLGPGTRVTLRAQPARRGTVALVLHDGHVHYMVRWDDGEVADHAESALARE